MRKVGVADLKARLSEYLRAVRRGESISVLDRSTPIAQIIPIPERAKLVVRRPAPGTPAPGRFAVPKALKVELDIVELLLEERQGSR